MPSITPINSKIQHPELGQPSDSPKGTVGDKIIDQISSIASVIITPSKIQYPEFGQPSDSPKRTFCHKVIDQISSIAPGILLVGAVALICGTSPLGLAVTGCVAVALIVYKIAKELFVILNSHRYRTVFDPTEKNLQAPSLGSYSQADLRLSNHATESFEWKKMLIASAQESIEFSVNFAGGQDFREVLTLIERRMELFPDLRCHLILSSDLLEKEDIKYLKILKKIYPTHFNYLITDRIYSISPSLRSEENHVKLLIVDGQYFAMGGTGIHEKMTREELPKEVAEDTSLGSKMISAAFRDSDIIGHGEVAQTMRNQFYNLYRIWEHRMTGQTIERFFPNVVAKKGRCEIFHDEKDEGLIKNSSLKYIVSGPEHLTNPISSEIADLMNQAKNEIKIANLLFNPGQIIRQALLKAKANKLKIEGYFNGTAKGSSVNNYMYALPARYNYNLLTDVFEYKKKDQLYHKKVTTIDDLITVIGSYNYGEKSEDYDYENVCVINDPRVTQLMNQALDADAKASKPYTDKKLRDKHQWSQLPGALVITAIGSLFG